MQRDNIKIGIVVTMHWSDEFRPEGDKYILNFIDSSEKHIEYEYTIYVVDNGSQHQINLSNYKNIKYIKIGDQQLHGITGAWNVGIYNAILDKCDIIINSNDDLTMNPTINEFIDYINNDKNSLNTVYGPISNGMLYGPQLSNAKKEGIVYAKHLNGFFFGMTSEHYNKYCFETDKYFNKDNKYNEGDGVWGGQEGQFMENFEKGCRFVITNFCWINHIKERGWKKTKKCLN